MTELLYICEYLVVTPRSFFDESAADLTRMEEAESVLHCLSDEDLSILMLLVKHLKKLQNSNNNIRDLHNANPADP